MNYNKKSVTDTHDINAFTSEPRTIDFEFPYIR